MLLRKMVESLFQSCMKMNSRFYTQRRSDDDQTETSVTKTQMNHFFCNFEDFKKDTFKTVEISVSKSHNQIGLPSEKSWNRHTKLVFPASRMKWFGHFLVLPASSSPKPFETAAMTDGEITKIEMNPILCCFEKIFQTLYSLKIVWRIVRHRLSRIIY